MTANDEDEVVEQLERRRALPPRPSLRSRRNRLTAAAASAGDEAAEVLAALLEVRVLVVARAGRAEQDDVARARLRRRVRDRARRACRRRARPGSRRRARPRPRRRGAPSARSARSRAASGAKLSPLSEPPRIRCTGSSSYAASARRAAATFVAFESLTKRTPAASPTSSSRCGTPGNVRSASAIASSPIPAARAAAVAAAAFSRLCAPRISGSAGSGSSAANSIPSRPSPRGTTFAPRPLEDAQLRVAVGLERRRSGRGGPARG